MEGEATKPKRGPGRPPSGKRKPDANLMVACNWEWKEAVDKIAKGESLSMSELIDKCLLEYCKRHRIAPPPPRISS